MVWAYAYADDILFHVSGKDVLLMKSKLETTCQIFMEWCKQNMLSLTPSKLEMILFSNSRLPIDNFYLEFEEYNVSLKENITYMGLLINKKLNWTNNIVSRYLKAKQYIFKIRRFVHSTWGIDGKILRML